MEARIGDWCDLCLEEVEDTRGTYRDNVFVICAECIAKEEDAGKLKEKLNDSRIT